MKYLCDTLVLYCVVVTVVSFIGGCTLRDACVFEKGIHTVLLYSRRSRERTCGHTADSGCALVNTELQFLKGR